MALTAVGQGYGSIFDPKDYGSPGGYGQEYGRVDFSVSLFSVIQ